MKYLLLVLVLITSPNPREIAKINKMKKEAERAYLNGEYDLALAKYNWLTDSMLVEDPAILLNKGHCYYHLNDSAAAQSNYRAVAATDGPKNLKSIAYQQLGVMAKSPTTLNMSLQFLKAAIKEDPSNMDARYDYEVVKKLIEQQKEQDEQNNQDDEEQEPPSEFAKELKRRSDELRSYGNFRAALKIMRDGLKRDPTVANYNDYMGRLEKVILGE